MNTLEAYEMYGGLKRFIKEEVWKENRKKHLRYVRGQKAFNKYWEALWI